MPSWSRRAIDLAVRLRLLHWQRLSAGRGSKGERWYDLAVIDNTDEAADPAASSTGHCWLLILRRPYFSGQLIGPRELWGQAGVSDPSGHAEQRLRRSILSMPMRQD